MRTDLMRTDMVRTGVMGAARSGAVKMILMPTRSQQAEEAIRRLILSGQPGDRLPGETDLARRLSTSRVTVREALARLWHAGLVVRRWGAGTFIADPSHSTAGSVYLGLDQIGSLPRRLTDAGHRVSLSHFATEPAAWPTWLASRPDGSAPLRVERCLAVDDVPAILLHDYIPGSIGGRSGPDPRTLSDIGHDLPGLFRDIGVRIVKDEATLHGAELDAPLAEHLALPVGSCVLHARQRSFSEAGEVVACAEVYYRSDVFTTTVVRTVPWSGQ